MKSGTENALLKNESSLKLEAEVMPKAVNSLLELALLAEQRKSVSIAWKGWTGRQGFIPAARVLNFRGSVLNRMFHDGAITEYEPKHPRRLKSKDEE